MGPCGAITLLLLVGLAILYAAFTVPDTILHGIEKAKIDEIKKKPVKNVTAAELLANKVRAENQYKDSPLNVTGIVTNITKTGDTGAEVTLNGKPSENEKGVSCKFGWDRFVESLSIGQTVTIWGIYKYDNYMEMCRIHDLNPSPQSYSPAPKPEPESYSPTPQPEPVKSSNPVFDSMLSRASAGDAKAQYELSQAYFDGKIVERNDNEGLKWLEKSAKNYDPDALFELGGMYLNGFLVKLDLKKGQYYMKKAAALGHEEAKVIVSLTESMMKLKPLMMKHSMSDEEYASLRQKATDGDPEAQCKLGMFYFAELHDNKEAVRWFFKAAQQGHSEANIKMQLIFEADPGLWSWFMNNPDARN